MPPVFGLLLPDQLLESGLTVSQVAAQVRSVSGPQIVASVIGGGPGGRASPAQQAVTAALDAVARELPGAAGAAFPGPSTAPPLGRAGRGPGRGLAGTRCRRRCAAAGTAVPGPAVDRAARRFAALPAAARHAWLLRNLAALRAGQVTLARLP